MTSYDLLSLTSLSLSFYSVSRRISFIAIVCRVRGPTVLAYLRGGWGEGGGRGESVC